jgi:hypothetical protein
MPRYLNVMSKDTPDEDSFRALALMELVDTGNWYKKINPHGDHSYSNIESQVDGVAKPSETVFNAKVKELKDAYASAEYKRKRVREYPSWQKQLDMQYWDKVNGTTTWQDTIAKVKNDIPKE